jgi:hypothetical protein
MDSPLTLPQVGKLAGVCRQTVHQAVKNGTLLAVRFGPVWMVAREEALRWSHHRRGPGRPRKTAATSRAPGAARRMSAPSRTGDARSRRRHTGPLEDRA